ncbi:Cntnap2 protein [Daphnia pulex]|uniref:Cntnap2 protein n=1 Tax=Daphnia pulex TaxID=6669 RepID=E9GVD6_DAPPU|nr:Cntnap2 protein [Daphnia pulex]|eukprot:EFX76551.1 Cntnap2 protein [Daphnia pulex]
MLKITTEILAAKIHQLEALERRIEQLELFSHDLQQRKCPTTNKSVPQNTEISRQSREKSSIPKTCHDIRVAHPSQTSGMYWIDPDGQGVGEDPIVAFCNMTTGSTAILHDSESRISVSHCSDPGCYSRLIKYSATSGQMTALAELSDECHQSIRYDCTSAPLKIYGIMFSWWNDNDGNPHYFWSGGKSNVHTCQCGIERNCVEDLAACNCDSSLPTPLTDIGNDHGQGVITDKNILPITRLNFGGTLTANSTSQHTLGRFECTGQVAVDEMPTSSGDHWRMEHKLNGLRSAIMGTDASDKFDCDFKTFQNNADFKKFIGMSVSAFFYVQKNTSFATTDIPIPFEIAMANVGDAINSTSGIFTAPQEGRYFFSFTGLAQFPFSSSYKLRLGVGLYLNGNLNGRSWVANKASDQHSPFRLESTQHLQPGDKVWLQITDISDGVYLYDNSNHYSHFTGWLLQKEIFEK